jgi:hypothetical protein
MKRTIASVLVVAAVILTIFGCASSQQPSAQARKPGKALVKRLPGRIQGVELAGNTVRVKPGFKWVKQPNGTVTVARMAGGGGLGSGGTWSCDCTTGPYSCEGVVEDNSLRCASRDCLACKLTTTTTGGLRTAIIAY